MSDFLQGKYYRVLDTKINDSEMDQIRKEFAPYIDMGENFFKQNRESLPYTDHGDFGEVIISIGCISPDSIFDYPLPGIQLKVIEHDEYWACYYLYDDLTYAERSFLCLVHKTYNGPFNTVETLIKKCQKETGYKKMGAKPRTVNILRTPAGCDWYRHVDVASRKLVIPIYSTKGSQFKWYHNNHCDDEEYIEKIDLEEGNIYAMNTHVWHSTLNASKKGTRWNLTLEEPYEG